MKAFLTAPFSSKYDKNEKKFDVLLKDLVISIIKVLKKMDLKFLVPIWLRSGGVNWLPLTNIYHEILKN